MNQFILNSPVGFLKISDNDNSITEISYIPETQVTKLLNTCASPLASDAIKQLSEYFNRKRSIFDLPLAPSGTPFQKKVWKALQTIPYGETWCYQDIAVAINNPKGAQAVGQANNKNPIAIVIPCHRVIGKSKKLVGYGGGIDKQEFLLELEHADFIK